VLLKYLYEEQLIMVSPKMLLHVLGCILAVVIVGDAKFLRYDRLTESDASSGVHWAIIVAGSNGWDNYRHQADACHAYQIVRKHGIPEERIVTMMYDDIAHNEANPTPGVIINHPAGKDVYAGVVIDYKGEDVTPSNFLAALSGDAERLRGVGTGKVIRSGPNDRIFVNFVDHGAPGLLAFPSSELYARDLISTLKKMHDEKKYKEMILYIEACESGSMFENLLPANVSIWASTASNAAESSYACYYDDSRETYLGDVYSVNWMEDSDKENLNLETLRQQFNIVKKETNTSHVSEYGDSTLAEDRVGDFQGESGTAIPDPIIVPDVPFDAVPSERVSLAILHRRLLSASDGASETAIRKKLMALLELNQKVDDTMKTIVDFATRGSRQSNRIMTSRYQLTAWDCYEPAVELFDERCFDISQVDQARHRLNILVNLCEEQVPVEKILEAIAKVCSSNV
jgi:legumain